jgi:hypothetical protein
MRQEDIDDELSTPGAQELLASTSAAHLAYMSARPEVALTIAAGDTPGAAR